MLELRAYGVEGLELREPGESTGGNYFTFTGHASVFRQLSKPIYERNIGRFREQIAPGAFRDVLREDVLFCYSHDTDSAMASTSAGNLDLREDPEGLKVWARLDPEDRDVQRLVPKMRNGVVRQMSFAFACDDDDYDLEVRDAEDGTEEVIRTINRIGYLREVSALAQGAYPQTDASIRQFLYQAVDLGARKDFSADKRQQLAKGGKALPDGSFPIENVSDLKNAIQAIGRAKDPGKAKAHIIKRAKALGASDLIPDSWRSLHADVEGHEDVSREAGASNVVTTEARRIAIARIKARVART